MTQTIKSGDTISVDYTGRFQNGKVFDTSEGRTPLKFTVGSGMMIRGFDQAVAGKTLEFDITIMETGLEPDSHDCGSGCGCDSGCCH